ncbi:DUF2066 domain-containing protein [Hyphomicrobium sp.]|uniref:DUF2066 domain-containing protein n=1 Tax=Hyphomicrobium sp. TaxID=82 RepID=UPI002E360B36|nr:DUF2066 domain-containing protein [Hyphomicrobium sp.]HEX2842006.1 DUF2066 domain-containing protein [Hyphomicrobium sp.]
MTARRLITPLTLGVLLAFVAGGAPFAGASSNKVYTVANYPVDATAKDAVAAKEKAHADGQQAALGALLKRLVPVTAYNRIDRLKTLRAANFVDGVAIRSESNSSTRYIASLDFSFQADAVRDLLTREGVPFVDEQSPRMVLVPVTAEAGEGGALRYRAASGNWNQVWKGLDLDNTLTPLRIETLLPSIHQDTIMAMLNGDDRVESVLTGEYKADFVLFAIADVDSGSRQVSITLAGIDAAGLLSWRRSYRVPDGDVGYAMELAAVVTQGVLEGRWKVAKSEDGGQGGSFGGGGEIRMAVEFSSLGEWNDLRRQLLETPGIDDVRIGAVSARTADVSVRYPGGGAGLAPVLAKQGLTLSGGGGAWTLRSGY